MKNEVIRFQLEKKHMVESSLIIPYRSLDVPLSDSLTSHTKQQPLQKLKDIISTLGLLEVPLSCHITDGKMPPS